jgi:DNA-binding NtrC family response regulator
VLRKLPRRDLRWLLDRSRVRELRAGTLLFEEGEPGASAFLLLKGRIAVRRWIGDEETVLIALRGPLEWIGEIALLEDAGRSASASAQDDIRVLEVPREAFLEVLARHGEAGLDLLRCVSERLRESDSVLIEALRKQTGTLVSANRRLRRENRVLRSSSVEDAGFEEFVGGSNRAKSIRAAARRAARSESPVLLQGEPGTGKTLLARGIHAASRSVGRPLVVVYCAAADELGLESELCGHAAGVLAAGAPGRPGLLEEADGGTLLLEEVGGLSRALQGVLLRLLESGGFERVGETRTREARVRVIATTTAGLEEAVREGRFRGDLLTRLGTMQITLSPLRTRRRDIAEIAMHLLRDQAQRRGVAPLRLTAPALDRLSRYPFPGNLRELAQEVERLYATLEPDSDVAASDLSARIRQCDELDIREYSPAVRAFKRRLVSTVVAECEGHQGRAAEELGLHRSNLSRIIRDLGLNDRD